MSQRKHLENRVRHLLGQQPHGVRLTGGAITSATKAGQQKYLDFMRDQKENYCLSHKEALAAWKKFKGTSCAKKKKPAARQKLTPKLRQIFEEDDFDGDYDGPSIAEMMADDVYDENQLDDYDGPSIADMLAQPEDIYIDDLDDFDYGAEPVTAPNHEECLKLLGLTGAGLVGGSLGSRLKKLRARAKKVRQKAPALIKQARSLERKYKNGTLNQKDAMKLVKQLTGGGLVGGQTRNMEMAEKEKLRIFLQEMRKHGMSDSEAVEVYKELKAKKGGNWFKSFTKTLGAVAPFLPLLL